MNVNFQLRPATLQDAADLQQALWPTWSVDVLRELIERVDGITRRGRGLGIIAINEQHILGYGQLTVWPRTTEISDLIVTPGCRNHGIGTAIIQHLIDKVRSWHFSQVEIGVALSNPRALALYQRLGFVEDRVINLDLGSGPEPVSYLVMSLSEASEEFQ
jgi:ribosomal protein S18 acetylase RimI-like enzyme